MSAVKILKKQPQEKKESGEIPLSKVLICALLFLVALSLFLRLYHIDYMEFKHDEALNSFKAATLAKEGLIPLSSGASSTGITEPPIFMYLLAVPFLFTGSPVGAAAYIALWNVAGIVLAFFFAKMYFGIRGAFMATALYAVNPWQVLFSRKIWTQNLLAPFVILFLFFLFLSLFKKRSKWIIIAGLVLGIVLQLHMSAAYALPVVAILVWIRRKQVNASHLSAAVILMLLAFFPYILLQARADFSDLRTAMLVIQKESTFHLDATTLLFQIFTTWGFDYSLGRSFSAFEAEIFRLKIVDMTAIGIFIFSLVTGAFFRKREYLYLLAWVAGGMLFLFIVKTPLAIHYFLSLFPVCFLLLGATLDWIASLFKSRYAAWGVYLLVGLITLYQFAFTLNFLNFVKKTSCIHGDYGPPYAYHVKRVQEVIDHYGRPRSIQDLNRIHQASVYCEKCDYVATAFITKYLTLEQSSR